MFSSMRSWPALSLVLATVVASRALAAPTDAQLAAAAAAAADYGSMTPASLLARTRELNDKY